jgi:hypothetical protein
MVLLNENGLLGNVNIQPIGKNLTEKRKKMLGDAKKDLLLRAGYVIGVEELILKLDGLLKQTNVLGVKDKG